MIPLKKETNGKKKLKNQRRCLTWRLSVLNKLKDHVKYDNVIGYAGHRYKMIPQRLSP